MVDTELPSLLEECGKAVEEALARHRWQLLEPEEFARRAMEHVRAGVASDPRRAATYTYSQALHIACSGAEGADRQNLGYTELFRYLYDSARRRYPDVSEDATQRALEATFTTFERCRQPGAFLAFAFQHLMDAARALRRQMGSGVRHLETCVGDSETALGELLPDPQASDPADEVIAGEQRSRLERCRAEFLRRHPRARQQFEALWLKYVEGLADAAIGERLGKPVSSVYVLRSRAIEKLRAEPSWRAIAAELGILRGAPSGTGVTCDDAPDATPDKCKS